MFYIIGSMHVWSDCSFYQWRTLFKVCTYIWLGSTWNHYTFLVAKQPSILLSLRLCQISFFSNIMFYLTTTTCTFVHRGGAHVVPASKPMSDIMHLLVLLSCLLECYLCSINLSKLMWRCNLVYIASYTGESAGFVEAGMRHIFLMWMSDHWYSI